MSQPELILAIDQGTTGTTALLMNRDLKTLASADVGFRQLYPKPGWVEHDLDDIWASVVKAIRAVLRGSPARAKKITAIGITNQRETACLWSKATGAPLYHAIVWQDRRTADFCDALKSRGHERFISEKTGLLLDPYFSASKIRWVLENVDTARRAVKRGDCAFGTIESYLVHRLTGGAAHVTEPSNASRTSLYDIVALDWNDDLLKLFGVPHGLLPEVRGSTDLFGRTQGVPGLPDGIPICGILGDQQSALLGQACVDEGSAKCTYGTGSFILLNTGTTLRRSRHRLLSTIAWTIGGKTTYALEGGAFTAGASVQWLREGLGIIRKSADVEALAKSVPTSGGVVFVPAFTGIGAPHWMPHARATIFGLTRGTTKAHVARAALQGIALMNHDILRAMEHDLGSRLRCLKVDGGASANDLLMQFQCDVLGSRLLRPKMIETTAMGAVFAAGLGIGLWKDLSAVKAAWRKDAEFRPGMSAKERSRVIAEWNATVDSLRPPTSRSRNRVDRL